MIKRVIWDIDKTLINPNYYKEVYFFNRVNPKLNKEFTNNLSAILKRYEEKYEKYEISQLLNFLNQYSGFPLDEKFIYNWFGFSQDLDEQNMDEVTGILTYISNKKSIQDQVILSNWFKAPQEGKLERVGIRHFFNEIYTGEICLKPRKQSFINACGPYRPDECVMIGDNLDADIKGAIQAGLHAIHYTNGDDVIHDYPKVKRLKELQKML